MPETSFLVPLPKSNLHVECVRVDADSWMLVYKNISSHPVKERRLDKTFSSIQAKAILDFLIDCSNRHGLYA